MTAFKNKVFFVSGIGTDVGKTVVSAILSEALEANYWKPIQSGDLDNSDSIKVKKWTENVTVLDEKYRLTNPLSPHTSARIDGVSISKNVNIPCVDSTLIVEGAGGLLVPLNDEGLTLGDWISEFKKPVIVVVRHYLGSINHTLLTLNYLKVNGIEIAGLVVTGEKHEESEKIIEKITGLEVNLYIPQSKEINKDFVTKQAQINKEKITKWLLG